MEHDRLDPAGIPRRCLSASRHPLRREQGKWPPAIPKWFRIFIGVAELLAAVGLALPGLFHLFTFLTPLAAAGLVIVMLSAFIYHVRRREGAAVPVVGALLVLIAIVAIVRWQVAAL